MGGWRSVAMDRAEAAYLASHPPPPKEEPPPPPYDTHDENGKPAVTPAGAEWCRITRTQHEYWRASIKAAKLDPEVVKLSQEYDALVARVWAHIDQVGARVGSVPGLAPCPACGAPGLHVPQPLDHSRSGGFAVCTLDDNHIIEWLPWGG